MKKTLTLFTALLLFGSMMMVKADYYVAGTMNGWSTNAEGYKMELVNGIYKLTKENLSLPKGETKFKVVQDNNWSTSWPGSDYVINIATAGTYTLTVTYNPSDNYVNAAKGPYYLAGSGLPGISWSSDAIQMDSENRKIFHNLSAGSYIIKVTDGSWNWSVGYDQRDGTNSNVTLAKDGDTNLKFTTTGSTPKDVIIAYHMGTNKITVNAYETAKVKFFAPRDENNPWDHVYVYAWDEGGSLTAPWPGDEITSAKEAEWYVYTIRKGGNLLFHDNNGMQTNDITNVQADVCYNSTAINYNSNPKEVTVTADGDCTMSYYIAGYKSLVGGSSDWSTHVALDANNVIVFEDVPQGEYAFKISNGTWAWSIGGNDHLKDGCASIAQTVGVGNVGFSIDHTQDITITYYPTTQEICLGAETTKATGTVSVTDMNLYVGKTKTIQYTTNIANHADPVYTIVSGGDYISIANGKITGVAAGTAVVRATIAETADYLGASDEFTITVSALQTAKIRFFAPRTEDNPWEHVYAYAWIGDDPQSAVWPGDEITSTKSSGWYEYDVPVGASVLFTDNNTTKGVMKTTDILNVTTAKSYVSTSIYYPEDPTAEKIVTVTEQNTVAYSIAGSKNLIEGEAEEGFDVNLPLDENNQIVFQNVEPGTYAFKINNGTWAWAIGGINHMKAGDCATIAQEVGVGDLGFKIDTKQDVTVTYYPETEEICLGAVTVKATGTVEGTDMSIKAGESKKITYTTNNTESPNVTYVVVSGGENIELFKGVITGVKHGTATIRVSLSETANYTAASDEFTVTIATPAAPTTAIETIGGKFLINAKGDSAVFSRGNLQYQQSSNTWTTAPKQYEWKGTANLQMGNSEYEGWVDLFCWSIGNENNYGATSAYNTALYYNKAFVDWGGLFEGSWSTLSINEWYYLLYNRANANNLWGMAMIGDTLGMVLLPEGWTNPNGVTFVPGTKPTTDMWEDADCLDPTKADEDHWRLNPENMPANKFTEQEWAILENAGAVFCPYGGRRSGGYGNHTNRQNETVDYEYAYSYYENYYGSYWTSTVHNAAEGKVYWLPMICNGCDATHENWGRGSHGWWENGRYGHSVRLVQIFPRQYTVTYDANGATGDVPTDNQKYPDGATVTLAAKGNLAKEGCEFLGWKFKGVTYNAEAAYTIANVLANEEIVFVAQWDPVVVSGNVNVSAIDAESNVRVKDGGTLNVNVNKTLNNVIIEAGGKVIGAKNLTVNDLTINAMGGYSTTDGKSGQIIGPNVAVTGNLYLEIKLCDGAMDAEASRKWYCISAPFDVNMNGGFFWGNGDQMGLNVDFQMFEYQGEKRARTGNGWQRVSGTMKANTAYFIGFNDERENQNVIKLKANNKTISDPESVALGESYESSLDDKHSNWHGVANPTYHYIGLNQVVQIFDYVLQGFNPYTSESSSSETENVDYGFVVGTPIFVKSNAASLEIQGAGNHLRAQKRQAEERYNYCVQISKADAKRFDNQLYVMASTTASTSYEEGQDVLTMNDESSKYGALIWTKNYGMRLAVEDAPFVGEKASYELGIYAPEAGEYAISVAAPKENADLYLTKNGMIIWNLSMNECTLDLNKGANDGYGLLLVRKAPEVSTGVESTEFSGQNATVQKVIIDEHVYILREGQMYDVTGKMVK